MATKVGGLFISLALDMAQFDDGMKSAADKTKRMEKFQGDLENAFDKGNKASERLAEKMVQLSGAGSQYSSMINSLIQTYDRYNDKLEAVYRQHDMAVTGLVRVQAALAALQATAKAFVPILVLEGLAKGAQWAGKAIGDLMNKAEEAQQRMMLIATGKASGQTDKDIAELRAKLAELRGDELTEQEILANKTASTWWQRAELRKLLDRETFKQTQQLMDEENQLKEDEWKEEQKRIEETAKLKMEKEKEYAESVKRASGIRKNMEDEARKWAKDFANDQKKINDLAKSYVDIIQGTGGEELERARYASMQAMGLIGGNAGGAAIAFNPAAAKSAAQSLMEANPSFGTVGSIETMIELMREQVELLKRDQEL